MALYFDFVENFFFVSLGITFVLILLLVLLVYHFKQRISSMERKGDTMFELITNVVKELQCMKGLNSYYNALFSGSGSIPSEQPACAFSGKICTPFTGSIPIISTNQPPPEKKVIDLTVNNDAFIVNENVQVVKQLTPKMVVSDDDSEESVSDDDSSTSETDYSSDTVESDMDESSVEEDVEEMDDYTQELQIEPLELPVEINDSLETPLEHLDDVTTELEHIVEEPLHIDVPTELNETLLAEVAIQSVTVNVNPENTNDLSEPTKEQKQELYYKMNITQLKSMAISAGIQQDVSKMKKKELISLLENLDE